MTDRRTPDSAPRWPTLVALTAAVLGVHVAMLLGPVGWPSTTATPPALVGASAAPPVERSGISSDALNTMPVARVSTVRWIVPAAAAEATAPRAPQPRPQPRLRPPTQERPAAPALATAVVNAAAEQPVPADDLAAISETGMPVEPAPLAESGSQSAPATEEVARDDPTESLDDEMVSVALKGRAAPAQGSARALPPAQPPASAQLDYAVTGRIKGIAYNADGKLDWTLADGRYSARMEIKVFLLGSRVQTSTGRVGPAGLMPERFADKSRSEKAAHFDNAQNRVRFSNNAPDAALLPGAQDRLSLFLQIAGLLQARPQAYVSGQIIDMQVVGAGDADIWRFEVGDEVALNLPAGDLRARLFKRLPRKEFDSQVELWMAPALQYLPVRLRVTQSSGDVADQQLSRMP